MYFLCTAPVKAARPVSNLGLAWEGGYIGTNFATRAMRWYRHPLLAALKDQ